MSEKAGIDPGGDAIHVFAIRRFNLLAKACIALLAFEQNDVTQHGVEFRFLLKMKIIYLFTNTFVINKKLEKLASFFFPPSTILDVLKMVPFEYLVND